MYGAFVERYVEGVWHSADKIMDLTLYGENVKYLSTLYLS